MAAGPVQAADLGGDCCADLEERVAELEATTARKGNRKVSLTVSGFVNEQVQWFDDGAESNVYQGTNGADPTQFRFVGKAKIDKDWSAGYIIELGVTSTAQQSYNQDNDDVGNTVQIRHSAWFLESKTYGKLTVGQTSAVNDGITEYSVPKNTAAKPIENSVNGGFYLRLSDGRLADVTWAGLSRSVEPGEGTRYNVVRYDSPEFAGFVASANWGEDDLWAVSLRYTGELHGFKIQGGFAYAEATDDTNQLGPTAGNPTSGNEWGGSISALHVDSGLFASFAYGEADVVINAVTGAKDEYKNWNVRAGIQKKWLPLGNTTLYGEYYEGDFGTAAAASTPPTSSRTNIAGLITGSEVNYWGAAALQDIDAAAMTLYIAYRHYEADVDGIGALSVEDFDTVWSGAKISF